MKKILLLIFAALLVALAITACSPQDDKQNNTNGETESPVIVLPKDNF